MLLTRVIVNVSSKGNGLKGDFRSATGKRVRLALGNGLTIEEVQERLKLVDAAAGDLTKLQAIGRM